MNLATLDVEARDTGIASAMVNAVQEMGGSIGTVLLNGIAVSSAAVYVSAHLLPGKTPRQLDELKLEAMVHGFTSAIWWAAGILVLAALITFILVNAGSSAAGQSSSSAEPINRIEGASYVRS